MLGAAFLAIGTVFFVAVALAVYRIVRGPSILDRMIATDMLVATLICALAAEMVQHEHLNTLPVLLVLAMSAFLATVGVARFVTQQDRSGGARGDAGSSSGGGVSGGGATGGATAADSGAAGTGSAR
jgi:multicomponent Na+:H+ antiporter subunit F